MNNLLPKEIHICPTGQSPTIVQILDGIRAYDSAASIEFAECPLCKTSLELRIKSGSIRVGYTYFAGAIHFDEVASAEVPELGISFPTSDDLRVTFGGKSWTYEGPSNAREWMFLPQGSFAVGRSSRDLQLNALGVRIEKICHHFSPLDATDRSESPPGDDYAFTAGDRLLMVGKRSALRRVFVRLREGT